MKEKLSKALTSQEINKENRKDTQESKYHSLATTPAFLDTVIIATNVLAPKSFVFHLSLRLKHNSKNDAPMRVNHVRTTITYQSSGSMIFPGVVDAFEGQDTQKRR